MSAYDLNVAESSFKAYILKYIEGADEKHATAVSDVLKKHVKHNLTADQWIDLCERLVTGSAVELEHVYAAVCETSKNEWVLAIDPVRYALSLVGKNVDELETWMRDKIIVNTILAISLSHLCETIYYYDELPEVEKEGKRKDTKLQTDWFDVLAESMQLCSERRKKERLVSALDGKKIVYIVGSHIEQSQSISSALSAVNKTAAPVFSSLF